MLPCLRQAEKEQSLRAGHYLMFFYSETCGRSTSSSAPSSGENPVPVCVVAWELRSGRKLRLWRDEFGPRRRTRLAPTVCLLPTTPAQKSVAISRSAGRCQSACWICSLSSVITPTVFPRSGASVDE